MVCSSRGLSRAADPEAVALGQPLSMSALCLCQQVSGAVLQLPRPMLRSVLVELHLPAFACNAATLPSSTHTPTLGPFSRVRYLHAGGARCRKMHHVEGTALKQVLHGRELSQCCLHLIVWVMTAGLYCSNVNQPQPCAGAVVYVLTQPLADGLV